MAGITSHDLQPYRGPQHAQYDSLRDFPTFSASFSQRATTRNSIFDAQNFSNSTVSYDFLSMITSIADLYTQDGVLEMKELKAGSKELDFPVRATGATSKVVTVEASFTQPSELNYYSLRSKRRQVVMKRYPPGLFHANGKPNDSSMAKSLITELKVLTHPGIRKSEYIVTILGLYWDSHILASPEPVIVLECGDYSLDEYLLKHPFLPSNTKLNLALDIAKGLETLHLHEVIHGDLKPQNILVFEESYQRLRAKLMDFGYSVFEKNQQMRLRARTAGYEAPEWEQSTTSELLKLTDVYSYGLVFTSIIINKCLLDWMAATEGHTNQEFDVEKLSELKKRDKILDFLVSIIYSLNDPTLADHGAVMDTLRLSVKKEPKTRNLSQIISRLALADVNTEKAQETVHQRTETATLAIPYQALEQIGNTVKDQVVRALQQVATMQSDKRRYEASWELSVCYISDFGIARDQDYDFDARYQTNAIEHLIKSAEGGDSMARVAVVPVLRALDPHRLVTVQLLDWVVQEAARGSVLGISLLKDRSLDNHTERQPSSGIPSSVGEHQQDLELVYSLNSPEDFDLTAELNDEGDTILHIAASNGDVRLISAIAERHLGDCDVNKQNRTGETPLLQAARAGHAESLYKLIQIGANASIISAAREGPLHFLSEFDVVDVKDVAEKLVSAHASSTIHTVSLSSTCKTLHRMNPTGGGTPVQRAVLSGNSAAVDAILDLEDQFMETEPGFMKSPVAVLHRLLAYAVKLHHTSIIELLGRRIPTGRSSREVKIWDNGRLRTLEDLWLFGSTSVNQKSGLNFPERFARIMRFGDRYVDVLHQTLRILQDTGYVKPNWRALMIQAIKYSRQDHVACIAPYLIEDPLSPSGVHYQMPSSDVESKMTIDCYQKELAEYSWASPSDNYKRWAADEPAMSAQCFLGPVLPVKNHRQAWILAEWAVYAQLREERGIFSLLLKWNNGIALHPGQSSIFFDVQRDSRKTQASSTFWSGRNRGEIVHDDDCRAYFPPPSSVFSIRPVAAQPSEQVDSACNRFDGTLNYCLLYMNSVARQQHRDLSYALILLDHLQRAYPDVRPRWTAKHYFEDICLGSSTYDSKQLVSPLYHATLGEWNELVELLHKWGASPVDVIPLTKSTVLSSLIKSVHDVSKLLPPLLKKSLDAKVSEVLAVEDLWSILLHPLHAREFRNRSIDDSRFYTTAIQWSHPHGKCILSWNKAETVKRKEAVLWRTLLAVSKEQSSLATVGQQSHLLTVAALQQNVEAFKALLEMGFNPVLPDPSLRFNSTISPVDAIYWISEVPEENCDLSGLELKICFEDISNTLRTHGFVQALDTYSPFSRYDELKCIAYVFLGLAIIASTIFLPILAAPAYVRWIYGSHYWRNDLPKSPGKALTLAVLFGTGAPVALLVFIFCLNKLAIDDPHDCCFSYWAVVMDFWVFIGGMGLLANLFRNPAAITLFIERFFGFWSIRIPIGVVGIAIIIFVLILVTLLAVYIALWEPENWLRINDRARLLCGGSRRAALAGSGKAVQYFLLRHFLEHSTPHDWCLPWRVPSRDSDFISQILKNIKVVDDRLVQCNSTPLPPTLSSNISRDSLPRLSIRNISLWKSLPLPSRPSRIEDVETGPLFHDDSLSPDA